MVYLYARDDYRLWEDEHGTDLPSGTFGENVTVGSLPNNPRVGDRIDFDGRVHLEFTGPRTPCATFAAPYEGSAG